MGEEQTIELNREAIMSAIEWHKTVADQIGSCTVSEKDINYYYALIKELTKQNDTLELTLTGVMHSVDKWLDGEELEQDEVKRAITMREKTLQIVEKLTEENAEVKANWQKLKESQESTCEECRAEFKRLTEENERLRAKIICEVIELIKSRGWAYGKGDVSNGEENILGYQISVTKLNQIVKEVMEGE